MNDPNFANQTMWTGDNLPILRGMNTACVDLIYLDPPFNSKANYAAPVGSQAAGAEFKDTWTLRDIDVAWLDLIEQKHPRVNRVIHAAMTDSDKSYLIYMAPRLIEMHRVLKPTGSIYLHCDPTMSHYLKLLMDAIWGRGNFRNEIVWKRSGRNDGKRFGWTHDLLLGYAGAGATWNNVFVPYDPEYIRRFYGEQDGRGPYKRVDLTGPGVAGGESGMPWRSAEPTSVGRCWSVPLNGLYAKWIEDYVIPGFRSEASPLRRLDMLDEADLIHWPKRGKGWPMLKRYLAASDGQRVNDVFDDIRMASNLSRERTGYPTQKPLALLDRIVTASSNAGDMVLDPFAGCATACVAANDLSRQWAGIDVSPVAFDLVRRRIEARGGLLYDITHREDVPQRTDLGKIQPYNCADNRKALYGEQGGYCAGCRQHFQPPNLTVDHIIARSQGGTDHLGNLQLLCSHCNAVKGNRGMEYLLTRLAG